MFLAPLLGRAALSFGPAEYFALTLAGLTLVAYLSQGSMIKALIMAMLGLLAGTVGMDPISGEERFTYGTLTLRDGFGLGAGGDGAFRYRGNFGKLGRHRHAIGLPNQDSRFAAQSQRLARQRVRRSRAVRCWAFFSAFFPGPDR